MMGARRLSRPSIARPIATKATRQPAEPTNSCASGGTTIAPALPPLAAIPTASPRRRTNQRTTVALQGMKAVLMPTPATNPYTT